MDSLYKRAVVKEKTVVGFFYSISRKGIGELWPLHLGENTIGCSEDNDIQLKELSVSCKHASILIEKTYPEEHLVACIKKVDKSSVVYVNGEKVITDKILCKDRDIVIVGSNYQLFLSLINARSLGLEISDAFASLEGWGGQEKSDISTDSGLPMKNGIFNPYSSDNRRFVSKSTAEVEREFEVSKSDRTIVS